MRASAGSGRAGRLLGPVARYLVEPRRAPFWLAALVGVAVALGGGTPAGRLAELRGFDLLSRLTAPGASRLPITIVGIDEASFAEIDRQWPWPRAMHAELADRLTAAGAAVVAFDLLFAEASDPLQDARFAEAIRSAGNVVLASDLVYQETNHVRQWLRVDPLPDLLHAGARGGLAGVALDPDAVVRRIPEYDDAFWREIVRRFEERRPGLIAPSAPPRGALIRYLGPDHTFPFVSYYQALDPDAFLPPGVFHDQIVLVGRDARASPDAGAAQADTFATPFTRATRWLTPGVEIHATILENVIGGSAIRPLRRTAEIALLAATLLLCAIAMRRWRPLVSALAALTLMASVAGVSWWLLLRHNAWLPAVGSVSAVALLYLCLGGRAYLSERRQRQELRRAFGFYLPKPVLDEIVAHPERLALGGERREITLLFTDIAGFTPIAERLTPEQTAQLLNRHLTEMTAIVLRRGGTVDKFIGDAVMAFWGAPLPDAAQADHACQAALEMQRAMAGLSGQLTGEGLPELRMRIGIHSGPAVVGNMGSEDRFAYTAVGDTVNLASRLEGVNKLYGTQILLSDATAARFSEKALLRPVDRVCVRGKTQPVDIFTLCDQPGLCVASREAIAAVRAREWDRAEELWRAVLAQVPGDGVAQLYLERIHAYRDRPPGGDGDGAVAVGDAGGAPGAAEC